MKVVILAGGLGTRLGEETYLKPKPMIEIGQNPILWHIMKIYSSFGFNEFIICLGYKGYTIKEYFNNYFMYQSDVTMDLSEDMLEVHKSKVEPWKITLVDTGLNTMTGGRMRKVKDYIGNETFMMTYGDGVGNINIKELLKFHKKHGKYATITAVQPSGRFGVLNIGKNNRVSSFQEKQRGDGSWINGGFFVLDPQVIDYIADDATSWEQDPLEELSSQKQVYAFKHTGFWQPMDTLRDKNQLENLWNNNKAPWKIWK